MKYAFKRKITNNKVSQKVCFNPTRDARNGIELLLQSVFGISDSGTYFSSLTHSLREGGKKRSFSFYRCTCVSFPSKVKKKRKKFRFSFPLKTIIYTLAG